MEAEIKMPTPLRCHLKRGCEIIEEKQDIIILQSPNGELFSWHRPSQTLTEFKNEEENNERRHGSD